MAREVITAEMIGELPLAEIERVTFYKRDGNWGQSPVTVPDCSRAVAKQAEVGAEARAIPIRARDVSAALNVDSL